MKSQLKDGCGEAGSQGMLRLQATVDDLRKDLQAVHASLRSQVATSHDSLTAKITESERRIRQRLDRGTNTLITALVCVVILLNMPAIVRVLVTALLAGVVTAFVVNEPAYRWAARACDLYRTKRT